MTDINDIDIILETYQNLVDDDVLTLEEAQSMFDDNIYDIIIETKSDIDSAYTDGLITAYEKDICYINIGIDANESYQDTITNIIESELSYLEEKKNDTNISRDEYIKRELEKQVKKEKRKQFFKKVGKTALAVGAGALAVNALKNSEKNGNTRGVVRADNPEYSQYFNDRDAKLKDAEKNYNKNFKKAKTDLERSNLNREYSQQVKNIHGAFNNSINEHNANKKQTYNQKRAAATNLINKQMSQTNDPEKLAEYKRKYDEINNKYDLDKENREKHSQYNRSDFYRKQELNREDPNNMSAARRLLFGGIHKRRMDKINKRYDEYNRNNI